MVATWVQFPWPFLLLGGVQALNDYLKARSPSSPWTSFLSSLTVAMTQKETQNQTGTQKVNQREELLVKWTILSQKILAAHPELKSDIDAIDALIRSS